MHEINSKGRGDAFTQTGAINTRHVGLPDKGPAVVCFVVWLGSIKEMGHSTDGLALVAVRMAY